MQTSIVYKAVSQDPATTIFGTDELISAVVREFPYKSLYEIGKTLTNEKKPYFAFKTIEHLQSWISLYFRGSYFICEAVISKYQPKLIPYWDSPDRFDAFWKSIRSKKKVRFGSMSTPRGTIFCESITPVKLIQI